MEAGEEALRLDLADFAAVRPAMEGTDVVVHLAAIPSEDTFERLLQANVAATYNVFEAARQAGARRVVFASTNHVTGFYRRSERVGPADPVRPDSMYGATKVFGEAVGRLYADKWGMEVVCLRIGAFGERRNRRGRAGALPPPPWSVPARVRRRGERRRSARATPRAARIRFDRQRR